MEAPAQREDARVLVIGASTGPRASSEASPTRPATVEVDATTLGELRGEAVPADRAQAVIELDLDGTVLTADADFREHLRAGQYGSGEEVEVAGALARAPMHLTCRAGAPVATRPEQVAEILPLPAPDALVAHRGTSPPLVHLATLLGSGGHGRPVETAGCTLLVAVAGGRVAFAVDSLHEIEPLLPDPDLVSLTAAVPG